MKKEILTAELVNEFGIEGNGRKLFYKLSHKIKRGQVPFHNDDIVKSLEEDKEFLLKDEFKQYVDDCLDGIEYVCISDAFGFYERLVFAATSCERCGKKEYLIFPTVIGGEHTFSMSDEDRFSMKEPEFYLKELAELNSFKWGGIK
jgi:hypothetical protein